MTFDDYWDRLVAAQPKLLRGGEVVVKDVPAFRRLLARAYNAGQVAQIENMRREMDAPFPDVLNAFMQGNRTKPF